MRHPRGAGGQVLVLEAINRGGGQGRGWLRAAGRWGQLGALLLAPGDPRCSPGAVEGWGRRGKLFVTHTKIEMIYFICSRTLRAAAPVPKKAFGKLPRQSGEPRGDTKARRGVRSGARTRATRQGNIGGKTRDASLQGSLRMSRAAGLQGSTNFHFSVFLFSFPCFLRLLAHRCPPGSRGFHPAGAGSRPAPCSGCGLSFRSRAGER